MNILITGGTGFIAPFLIDALLKKGHKLTILLHKSPFEKNKKSSVSVIRSLTEVTSSSKVDAIFNLAGAPISKRWSSEYKKQLLESRLHITWQLIELINRLETVPKVLISASAIGYYGPQPEMGEPCIETTSPIESFTHRLCDEWEKSALEAESKGVRVCIARLGVVLGKNGGALDKILPAFRMGLGGKIATGDQYFSWVHIEDVVGAFLFLLETPETQGFYNIVSPYPLKNKTFAKALAIALNRPAFFHVPAFLVRALFGEMGEELLLNGANISPHNLKKQGYEFKYPEINLALNSIVGKND